MGHFETIDTCCGYIEDVHVNFASETISFDKITAFSTSGNFEVSLQRRLASLCNQLHPWFASNQFETLHICYKHDEDVHMSLSKQENNFSQNYGILDLDNFQVSLQYGVASLCNQLLPEFSSNQFETLHICYKHIEDVHATFSRKDNHFRQNYGILDRQFSG